MCAPTEVFRQAATSLIVTNAHRINRGSFRLNSSSGDFFLIEERNGQHGGPGGRFSQAPVASTYGLDPMEDIQVLSPKTN